MYSEAYRFHKRVFKTEAIEETLNNSVTMSCDTANIKNKCQTYLNTFQISLSVAYIYSVTHDATTSTSVQQLSTHHLHISADETMSARGVFDDLRDAPDCP